MAKSVVVLVPRDDVTKIPVQEAATQLTGISHSVETCRAKIGYVRRFTRKQSPVAFAGADPSPDDSGDRYSRSNGTTKRGSTYLRKTLFLIMSGLIEKSSADDPVCRFLDKKRSEGKPYYDYMTAGASKFLCCYYGIVMKYPDTLEAESTLFAGCYN